MSNETLLYSEVAGFPCRRGKVRDVYDLGDRLVIIATDRISAFDYVMQNGIPEKGRMLTAMSLFWFQWLGVPNHVISDKIEDLPEAFRQQANLFNGRVMLVRKTEVVPFECVARGYLAGSGWKEYYQGGKICGIALPPGLREADRLPEPIFTPATKADSGHDENVSFDWMAKSIGLEKATELQDRTLDIYRRAAKHAESRGIILADTKFEWGQLPDGSLILIDEVLTPDSSRFWPRDSYHPGSSPPSFDKQYLRDWLERTGWDKNSAPPLLSPEVIERTAAKYREALNRLTR